MLNGTSIACTWNDELVEKLFAKVGEEAKHFACNKIDIVKRNAKKQKANAEGNPQEPEGE